MNISIDDLFEMLSWNSPKEIQEIGLHEARRVRNLSVFLQPIESKSVWENCARVLVEKTDSQLQLYLIQLFEWLQDMNWPGASLISERLSRMSRSLLQFAYDASLRKAIQTHDDCWKENLLEFWTQKKY